MNSNLPPAAPQRRDFSDADRQLTGSPLNPSPDCGMGWAKAHPEAHPGAAAFWCQGCGYYHPCPLMPDGGTQHVVGRCPVCSGDILDSGWDDDPEHWTHACAVPAVAAGPGTDGGE